MTTEVTARLHSDLAVPPGALLQEELEAREMSQKELARLMGRPAQLVNEIVRARKRITEQTALELESALSIPAHIWLGLESQYRLTLARQARNRKAG
ncbi:MAG: HigA family addiction module antidote protein [Dehalococcoidia bacterium]|nr:HigA family addiction module antidote protein [Dehalococcoidia bacterium]